MITLFSETSRQPDGELLRQFSSVVSLVGLGIEHQHWKSALEASSANERFIRDIGMEIVNIPADDYVGGLTARRPPAPGPLRPGRAEYLGSPAGQPVTGTGGREPS